jgi:DNA invertase Pin-like site-specific DNA recombinase
MLDMRRDGTVPDRRGEKSPAARLTDEQVLEIRTSADTARELATRYGVCRSTIYNVLNGTTWGHL